MARAQLIRWGLHLQAVLSQWPPASPGPAGPQEAAAFLRTVFSLNDPDEVRSLFDGAGFQDVTVQDTARALRLPGPAEFLWQYLYATPLAEAVRKMDDERLRALERDVVDQAQGLVEDGGKAIEQDIVVATGRA